MLTIKIEQRWLECPVCRKRLDESCKMLPFCQHTFCKPCLNKMYDNENSLICAQCKRKFNNRFGGNLVDALPANLLLLRLIKQANQNTSQRPQNEANPTEDCEEEKTKIILFKLYEQLRIQLATEVSKHDALKNAQNMNEKFKNALVEDQKKKNYADSLLKLNELLEKLNAVEVLLKKKSEASKSHPEVEKNRTTFASRATRNPSPAGLISHQSSESKKRKSHPEIEENCTIFGSRAARNPSPPPELSSLDSTFTSPVVHDQKSRSKTYKTNPEIKEDCIIIGSETAKTPTLLDFTFAVPVAHDQKSRSKTCKKNPEIDEDCIIVDSEAPEKPGLHDSTFAVPINRNLKINWKTHKSRPEIEKNGTILASEATKKPGSLRDLTFATPVPHDQNSKSKAYKSNPENEENCTTTKKRGPPNVIFASPIPPNHKKCKLNPIIEESRTIVGSKATKKPESLDLTSAVPAAQNQDGNQFSTWDDYVRSLLLQQPKSSTSAVAPHNAGTTYSSPFSKFSTANSSLGSVTKSPSSTASFTSASIFETQTIKKSDGLNSTVNNSISTNTISSFKFDLPVVHNQDSDYSSKWDDYVKPSLQQQAESSISEHTTSSLNVGAKTFSLPSSSSKPNPHLRSATVTELASTATSRSVSTFETKTIKKKKLRQPKSSTSADTPVTPYSLNADMLSNSPFKPKIVTKSASTAPSSSTTLTETEIVDELNKWRSPFFKFPILLDPKSRSTSTDTPLTSSSSNAGTTKFSSLPCSLYSNASAFNVSIFDTQPIKKSEGLNLTDNNPLSTNDSSSFSFVLSVVNNQDQNHSSELENSVEPLSLQQPNSSTSEVTLLESSSSNDGTATVSSTFSFSMANSQLGSKTETKLASPTAPPSSNNSSGSCLGFHPTVFDNQDKNHSIKMDISGEPSSLQTPEQSSFAVTPLASSSLNASTATISSTFSFSMANSQLGSKTETKLVSLTAPPSSNNSSGSCLGFHPPVFDNQDKNHSIKMDISGEPSSLQTPEQSSFAVTPLASSSLNASTATVSSKSSFSTENSQLGSTTATKLASSTASSSSNYIFGSSLTFDPDDQGGMKSKQGRQKRRKKENRKVRLIMEHCSMLNNLENNSLQQSPESSTMVVASYSSCSDTTAFNSVTSEPTSNSDFEVTSTPPQWSKTATGTVDCSNETPCSSEIDSQVPGSAISNTTPNSNASIDDSKECASSAELKTTVTCLSTTATELMSATETIDASNETLCSLEIEAQVLDSTISNTTPYSNASIDDSNESPCFTELPTTATETMDCSNDNPYSSEIEAKVSDLDILNTTPNSNASIDNSNESICSTELTTTVTCLSTTAIGDTDCSNKTSFSSEIEAQMPGSVMTDTTPNSNASIDDSNEFPCSYESTTTVTETVDCSNETPRSSAIMADVSGSAICNPGPNSNTSIEDFDESPCSTGLTIVTCLPTTETELVAATGTVDVSNNSPFSSEIESQLSGSTISNITPNSNINVSNQPPWSTESTATVIGAVEAANEIPCFSATTADVSGSAICNPSPNSNASIEDSDESPCCTELTTVTCLPITETELVAATGIVDVSSYSPCSSEIEAQVPGSTISNTTPNSNINVSNEPPGSTELTATVTGAVDGSNEIPCFSATTADVSGSAICNPLPNLNASIDDSNESLYSTELATTATCLSTTETELVAATGIVDVSNDSPCSSEVEAQAPSSIISNTPPNSNIDVSNEPPCSTESTTDVTETVVWSNETPCCSASIPDVSGSAICNPAENSNASIQDSDESLHFTEWIIATCLSVTETKLVAATGVVDCLNDALFSSEIESQVPGSTISSTTPNSNAYIDDSNELSCSAELTTTVIGAVDGSNETPCSVASTADGSGSAICNLSTNSITSMVDCNESPCSVELATTATGLLADIGAVDCSSNTPCSSAIESQVPGSIISNITSNSNVSIDDSNESCSPVIQSQTPD